MSGLVEEARRVGAGQVRLIPDQPPIQEMATLDLAALPPDAELEGPEPGPDLVLTVAAFGVREPIMVQAASRRADGVAYSVIEGRRRIKAARRAKQETIIALVVEQDGSYLPDTLGLLLHATRSDNQIVDLRRIEELEAAGATEAEIAEATGMAKGTQRKRKRLQGLIAALRAGVERGAITISVAETAARLGAEPQARLANLLAANGTVTAGDVKAERVAGRQDALDGFDFDQGPSAEELAAQEERQAATRALLGRVLDLVTTWHRAAASYLDATPAPGDPDALVIAEPGGMRYRLTLTALPELSATE